MVQEREVIGSSLEIRVGNEILQEHDEILAAIVNSSWGWLFNATPEIIRRRLDSGHPFVAAYDTKRPEEVLYGADLSGHDGKKIPTVFLETVVLRTEGRYENVPGDYFQLTNSGLWAPPVIDPDTVIMVDITATPSRKGLNPGVGKVIEYAKALFNGSINHSFPFDMRGIEHIWTYSPDDRRVRIMHERNGAKDTGFTIPYSRVPLDFVTYIDGQRKIDPSFSNPLMNTHILSYRG